MVSAPLMPLAQRSAVDREHGPIPVPDSRRAEEPVPPKEHCARRAFPGGGPGARADAGHRPGVPAVRVGGRRAAAGWRCASHRRRRRGARRGRLAADGHGRRRARASGAAACRPGRARRAPSAGGAEARRLLPVECESELACQSGDQTPPGRSGRRPRMVVVALCPRAARARTRAARRVLRMGRWIWTPTSASSSHRA